MCNSINNGGSCQPSSGAVGEKTCVVSTPQNSNPQVSEPAMGTIYKITCLVDGKFYVGQTRQKLNRRISQHKSSKRESGIDAAIRKYGWDGNFTIEVLEVCPVEKLSEREIFFIAELDCKAPKGYNLKDGGSGTNPSEETRARISANHADFSGEKNPFYGKKHTKEECAIMSSSKKGKSHKPHSKETRDKIATSNKGKHSHNKGKHLPESQKAKMSIARKAWWAKKKLENGGNK